MRSFQNYFKRKTNNQRQKKQILYKLYKGEKYGENRKKSSRENALGEG